MIERTKLQVLRLLWRWRQQGMSLREFLSWTWQILTADAAARRLPPFTDVELDLRPPAWLRTRVRELARRRGAR